MSDYVVGFEQPNVEEFIALRRKIGWGDTQYEMANISLDNSLFHVTVRDNAQLIAMGRVIGDGAMFFYVQDVVVDPGYQGKGLGKLLMQHIESYLASVAEKGTTIGLLASQGKEAFYKRYGYVGRDGEALGLGMCKFV